MPKLSELANNTVLCVENNYDGELRIMDKAEFLDSAYFLDYPIEPFPDVTVAVPEIKTFNTRDLASFIENLGEDDTYEGWAEDVYDTIKNSPETEAFLRILNTAFASHITYYEDLHVDIDMVPERRTISDD